MHARPARGANRRRRRPQRDVNRRRARGHPALLRRVRWGNVGRLAALLAAGTLIATGGRGCRQEPSVPLREEEPGAALGRADSGRSGDARGRERDGARDDRTEAGRGRGRGDGKPGADARGDAKRGAAERAGKRPPRGGGSRKLRAKRERARRERAGREQARERPSVRPPPASSPAPPPSIPAPVNGEAAPPAGETEGTPRWGGVEEIAPPRNERAPSRPKSGEFTPDPAP
jgi:hypothetical protein